MEAAGLKSRELSKTMFYALLYGSSFKRLSEILDCPITEAKNILDRFYRQLPFLKQIKIDIIEKIEAYGVLKALDQRILTVRSNHATLNTLIQSCGAIIMKKALTILWDNLKDKDAWVVATIHDEFQIEAKKEEAEFVGQLAVDSIKKAGEHFKLRVPISASFRVGNNWSETH
jgi:DNA polymerase I-like protein with 3'-5' exonuclease and polymerase domains